MITIVGFKASGLEKASYPIQVAWNIGRHVKSHLINPRFTSGWAWRSCEFGHIYGISRQFLVDH